MKVSEAVNVLVSRAAANRADTVLGSAVKALLASHEALRLALTSSREGWVNVLELGLLPPQHRPAAEALAEEAWRALSLAVEEASK